MSKPNFERALWTVVPILWDEKNCENPALKSWRIWDDFRMSLNHNHRTGVAIKLDEPQFTIILAQKLANFFFVKN